MKKILLFLLISIPVFSQEKPLIPFDSYFTFGMNYLMPQNEMTDLAKNGTSLSLNYQYKLKKLFYIGIHFQVANLEPEFKHEAFMYEQERRWYNFGPAISIPLWQQRTPKLYRRKFLVKPQSCLLFELKAGYYTHSLIFKILQQKIQFWGEDELNFSRHGFGIAPGISFFKMFDIGFGTPLLFNIKVFYHFVQTTSKRDQYYFYYEDQSYGLIDPPFPGTLTENYLQITLGFSICNLKHNPGRKK